jgi:hypothetical protein
LRCIRFPASVLDVACNRQAFCRKFRALPDPPAHRNVAEIEEPGCLSIPMSKLAEDADGFFLVIVGLRQVVLLQMQLRKHGQGHRDLASVPQASVNIQAFGKHPGPFHIVALVASEHATYVERVSARHTRFADTRKHERCVDILPGFCRVTPTPAELHQRHFELDRYHRIDPARQRQRNGGAQIVEFDLQAPCPLRLFGSLQLAVRSLCNAQVILAMSRRRRRKA